MKFHSQIILLTLVGPQVFLPPAHASSVWIRHGPFNPLESEPAVFLTDTDYPTDCDPIHICSGPIDPLTYKDLTNCSTIDGDLTISSYIRYPALCLTHVTGNVTMEHNTVSTSFFSFGRLTQIDGDLIVHHNKVLTRLHGLDKLEIVNGELSIIGNSATMTLSAIDQLTWNQQKVRNPEDAMISPQRSTADDNKYHLPRRVSPQLSDSDLLSSVLVAEDTLVSFDNLHGLGQLAFVGGGVFIEDNAQLVDLSGVEALIEIQGDLVIQNNFELATLDGFISLTDVGSTEYNGSLVISGNNKLADMNGLPQINNIAGNLVVTSNTALTDLCGARSLVSIGLDARVESNPSLKSICNTGSILGLANVGRNLQVINNRVLQTLSGLGSLIEVTGDFLSYQNPMLETLENGVIALKSVGGRLQLTGPFQNMNGLDALTDVGTHLIISKNPYLISLHGLESLAFVGGDVLIFNNPLLESIAEITSLQSISGDLTVQGNALLSDVDPALATIEAIDGYVQIEFANGTIDCPRGCDATSPQVEPSGTLVEYPVPPSQGPFSESGMVMPTDVAWSRCTLNCAEGRSLVGNAGIATGSDPVRMWQCAVRGLWDESTGPWCL